MIEAFQNDETFINGGNPPLHFIEKPCLLDISHGYQ